MQLKFTTDYAIRMLIYLVLKSGVSNSKEISDNLDIPQKNVLSIGRKLKSANYVRIITGPYGGYMMAKKPEDITLFELLSVFEDLKISCHGERVKGNQKTVDAAVNSLYAGLKTVIEKKVKSQTLAELVQSVEKLK